MTAPTYLKVTLKLMAAYAGLIGAIMLFFQSTGQFFFNRSVLDPVVTRYWGGTLIALCVFYLFLSYDPEKYRAFLWVGVFDLATAMFITIYNIARAGMLWYQGIVALVINPIFIVLLLSGLTHKDEGKVVFEVGADLAAKPGQELPPHITGHHPLHGK
ncbi:hypothetical protein KY363_04605 [Candidatus Woesearchaeota archaeon]|nr:hypothetical protein [Candidatus Woesearchaeota archaeon]